MKDGLNEIRRLVVDFELQLKELAKQNDVENLSGPQGMTVFFLWKHRDKEVYIKDIEEALEISKSVASNLIKRMVKNGFIQVIPSERDKRYKQVVLTSLGIEKSKKLETFHVEMNNRFFKGISFKDLRTAHRVFEKIKYNLENED